MAPILACRCLLNQKSQKHTCVISKHGSCYAHLLEEMLQPSQNHVQIEMAGFKPQVAPQVPVHGMQHCMPLR